MDKGKQPTIWAGHNFNRLTEEAFRRSEEKARAQAVSAILDRPDRNEANTIGFLSENTLSRLSWALERVFEVNLASGPCDTVKVKLFNPHQCVKDNPSTLPVEVHTSVVACDAYAAWEKNKAKVIGSILLFKLSANLINDPVPDMTAKDLVWGENCTYGAFVNGDAINYFEITQTSGDVV